MIDINDGVGIDSGFGGEGDYFLFGVDVFGGVVEAGDDFAFFFGGHALRFGGHDDDCDYSLGVNGGELGCGGCVDAVIMGLIERW